MAVRDQKVLEVRGVLDTAGDKIIVRVQYELESDKDGCGRARERDMTTGEPRDSHGTSQVSSRGGER